MAGRERATGGGGESTGVGAGNFKNVQHRGGLEWAAGTRARAGGGKPGKRDVNRASFSTNRQRWPKRRTVAAQGSERGAIVGKRTRAGAKGLIDNNLHGPGRGGAASSYAIDAWMRRN
ncbi:hypothetical protein FB451DRAFT_1185979 [Mycena latifolia]|nr:hypothetical protein FB451DRAFT_1185979 [Mycena latifolia]